MSPNIKKNEYIELNLQGKNAKRFKRVFSKFSTTLEDLLDSISEKPLEEGTSENIEDITKILQNFIEAKASKPSIENTKLLAEIVNEYERNKEIKANTRKLNAEARSIEIDNTIKNIKAVIEAINIFSTIKYDANDNKFVLDLTDN